MIKMEVCANSVRSALAAQEGGAVRVELCDNLPEGGTTPSYAQIAMARKLLTIQLYPIIRPRGGDFLYDDLEFELMKEDIRICKDLNCDGVVIGLLNPDGTIDKLRSKILIDLAAPMKVTFHRAFDRCADMHAALEDIIELGCERILTSGGAASAAEGSSKIRELISCAGGRIIIMPGAGINTANIHELIEKTGAAEFHASARSNVPSQMLYRNTHTVIGSDTEEYTYPFTSAETVRQLLLEANRA